MGKAIILTIFVILFSQFTFASNWKNRGGFIPDVSAMKGGKSWISLGESESDSISQLLTIIETTSVGVKLLYRTREKAERSNKSILDVIKAGNVSLTDTTLIRRFSAIDPKEVEYEARSLVYLDRSHNVKNAVLDLVHELTHYVYKVPFNPYRSKFSITQFMKDTIEGRGGEVDAFVVECKIGQQIFGASSISTQCEMIKNSGGKFSRRLAKYEFYKLGNYFDEFIRSAQKYELNLTKLNFLSKKEALLISSAWGSPYPMAVLEEYSAIMGKVCENDKRRLSYFESSSGRHPAAQYDSFSNMRNRVATRCKSFL